MRSEVARIGMRVRVHESLQSAELRGKEGTITRRWGNPHYVALDVLLEDGTSQLFWHHELEEISTPQPTLWRYLLGGDSANNAQ
jgi:hypothetical protein